MSFIITNYGTDINSSGIYMWLCEYSDKCYVGQAKHLKNRYYTHVCTLKKNKHKNQHLQNAWNKYGEGSFSFVVLENTSLESLNDREGFYASKYVDKLYNLREVGDYVQMTDEVKRKISEGNKGNKNCLGLKNALGYRHSNEAKERIAKASKGRKIERKINMTIATSIRERVINGEKQISLAMEYSISPSTITDIIKNRTWRVN